MPSENRTTSSTVASPVSVWMRLLNVGPGSGKTSKVAMVVGMAVMVLCVVVGTVLTLAFLDSPDDPYVLLTMGLDLFGMFICVALFAGALMDQANLLANGKWFLALMVCTCTVLLFDLGAWVFDESATFRDLNIAANTLLFLGGISVSFLCWHFAVESLEMKLTDVLVPTMALDLLALVEVILILANVATGAFFTVDANGTYEHGPLYFLIVLYALIIFVAIVVLAVKANASLKRKVSLIAYFAVPSFLAIATYSAETLSIVYSSLTISLLVIFCGIFADRGRESHQAEADMQFAATIQDSALSKRFPQDPRFSLFASMHPARDVGGDFYDFFMVDDDTLAVVMADVSGKGTPAALFMMQAKSLLRSYVEGGRNLGDAITAVNNRLCDGNEMSMFVTAWVGLINVCTGEVTYVNAGHTPPAVCPAGGSFEVRKTPASLVLGGMEDIPYRECTLQLQAGDTLYLYTDGVPEAADKQGKRYENDSMLAALNSSADRANPQAVCEAVHADVMAYMSGADQFDDVTMLCVHLS
ncbi:MAG: SpoIIE family protein phosphatase [Coriobacteriia bacterium]|nr:SpoIIE family protein phosphatase [Coriobacteriia bacterium]